MTDYGRGHGSQPGHPEDSLYGDRGWEDGRAGYQGGWEEPYGGDQRGSGQYDPQQAQFGPGGPNAGWDTTQGMQQPYDPYGTGHTDPYGMAPVDPYSTGEQPNFYAAQEAYRTRPVPRPYPQEPYRDEPEPARDSGYHTGEHVFFSQADTDDRDDYASDAGDRHDQEDDGSAPGRKGRRGGQNRRGGNKRRSGRACLVVSVLLVGGVGTVGYFGYEFYNSHFAPPPDFAGKGDGEAAVEIPDNATISDMGNILKRAGVVRSHDAFVEAAGQSGGDRIQSGSYMLRERMSASSAVRLMLDPASQNALIIPEGSRNSKIYSLIDEKTGVAPGTTKKVARENSRSLGLPSWAGGPKVKDPLEGFLYPSRYTVGEKEKPQKVLRKMVARAEKRYEALGITQKAKKVGLKSPHEVLVVASLIQAEGRTHDDFRKMAEVVYNRLKTGNTETNGMLEFDSTYNYIKDQSEIDLTVSELRNYNNRYNTYFYKGLPPGPIGNPGDDALRAALNPSGGGWYYFISLDNETSQFTKTYAEHEKLVEQFRKKREGQ